MPGLRLIGNWFLLTASMLSVSLYCSVASAMPQSASTESIAGTIEKGDFAAAVSACEAALQAKPNDVELTRLHAQALRGMNRVAAIPAALSPAIEAHPRASSLILQRAIAYKPVSYTHLTLPTICSV